MTNDKTTQPAAQPQWQPIETAPKDGSKLILSYINRNDMPRTVMARWLTDDEAAETDADGVGLEGGWYECIDNWDDYTEVAIHEGEPTHWMPLPAAPSAQAEPIAAHEAEQQAPPYTAPKLRALIDRVAEQQAGEAVAAGYVRNGLIEQLQGGKDCVMAALARTPCNLFTVPLYTRPQQPLSGAEAASIFKAWREGPLWLHMTRGVEAAHGIGIAKETK